MGSDTPTLFLEALAGASSEEWVESMVLRDTGMEPESIRTVIDGMDQLSVEPGERILEDLEGGYRAVFPESRWTWRLPGGRIGSVTGESVVEWRPGGYRWATVPLFTEEAAEIGTRERLCMGAVAMMAVLLVTVFVIWYVKRKYG